MKILFIMIFLFVCLVVVAVKYDRIIPPVSKVITRPRVYWGIITLLSAWILLQDWGTVMFAPGLQSPEKYGRPVRTSLMVLMFIYVFGAWGYILYRKLSSQPKPGQKTCASCQKELDQSELKSELCPECSQAGEDGSGLSDEDTCLLKKKNDQIT